MTMRGLVLPGLLLLISGTAMAKGPHPAMSGITAGLALSALSFGTR